MLWYRLEITKGAKQSLTGNYVTFTLNNNKKKIASYLHNQTSIQFIKNIIYKTLEWDNYSLSIDMSFF